MKYLFSLLILFFLCIQVKAQSTDSTQQVKLTTNDKQTFTGELVKISEDSIVIRDIELGVLYFHRDDIKKFRSTILSPLFSGTPNSSVPYFVQTALPNGNGNHYYKNYYLFANEFNFGLSDNFNFSLGFESASLIFDFGNRVPILQIGGKYAGEIGKNVHMGFSSKYYFNNEGNILLLAAPITIGNKRTNFTISPNYVREGGNGYVGILSNFSKSISPQVRLLVDYAYIDEYSIGTVMLEILFRSGFTLTAGAFVSIDGSAPNLAFSIPFGKWKSKSKE